MSLDIVVLGLSITSSWGNGHAATYRALIKALHGRGHSVTFLERDVPWYRDNRDMAAADYCRIETYDDLSALARQYGPLIAKADIVILGSFVPDGARIGDWLTSSARGVTAFYDIDTPVTIAGLGCGKTPYISASLIPRFDLYLSFTGGPLLGLIEKTYGSPRARPLYCASELVAPEVAEAPMRWSLGYLGTFSDDRQPALERLLVATARRLPKQKFVVAGPQYPNTIDWPANVERIEHLPQSRHASFYSAQRFTLNITRTQMRLTGYSPSVRLFEAACCEVPIISDRWPGLDTFFTIGREILVAETTQQVVRLIVETSEQQRKSIARKLWRRDTVPESSKLWRDE